MFARDLLAKSIESNIYHMGFYSEHLLPKIVHCACAREPVKQQRKTLIPKASGVVLDVGVGSGLNMPYYDNLRVKKVIGIDPHAQLLKKAFEICRTLPLDCELIKSSIEDLVLADKSIDTIVSTYTLCSVSDIEKAFAKFKKILKPGGTLLFSEHGLSPDPAISQWQNRLTPFWEKITGGCQLNRHIPTMIETGGFHIQSLKSDYLCGLRFACFNYLGSAQLA